MGHRKKHPYRKRLPSLDPVARILLLKSQPPSNVNMYELVSLVALLTKEQEAEVKAAFIKLKEDSDATVHTIPLPSY